MLTGLTFLDKRALMKETVDGEVKLPSVGVQRTARRIMDGTLYIRK